MQRSDSHLGVFRHFVRVGITLLFAQGVIGCAKHYKESADKEVYEILQKKQVKTLGEAKPFSIEPLKESPMDFLEQQDPETAAKGEQFNLTLSDTLELAARYSREYQTRKEQLYLSALSLTLERHRYAPIFSGKLSGRRKRADHEERHEGSASFSLSQLLSTGGRIGLSLSSDVLRYVTGEPRTKSSSLLALDFTQPLWRGAGRRIAQENLTQAERDTVYAIRSFARYHTTFCVQIASSFYKVLQKQDTVRNARQNYENLVAARERAEMLGQAGRLPEFQVDQARQDELRARDRWVSVLQQYEEELDRFRMELGLPADARVQFDYAEMERLRREGLRPVEITLEDATSIALQRRLDFLTELDQVEDAKRKVEVAKNGLAPDVKLVGGASVGTMPNNKPVAFRFDRGTYSGGLDVELPFDRKSERNTYREALITLEQRQRELEKTRDHIKLEIRRALRRLEQARQSYEIQRASLLLAERRVESVNLLLQAGRATTRDLLEAQEALIQAQNSLTAALVDYAIACLELYRDMEVLHVEEDGTWWVEPLARETKNESTQPKQPT